MVLFIAQRGTESLLNSRQDVVHASLHLLPIVGTCAVGGFIMDVYTVRKSKESCAGESGTMGSGSVGDSTLGRSPSGHEVIQLIEKRVDIEACHVLDPGAVGVGESLLNLSLPLIRPQADGSGPLNHPQGAGRGPRDGGIDPGLVPGTRRSLCPRKALGLTRASQA